MKIRLETLTGAAMVPLLPHLARLRIAVFREFPYLYAGDQAEEERHLGAFAASASAGLVVAWEGDVAVGCATCMRLAEASASVIAPFRDGGLDPDDFFYFGESVLLPAYRGIGVGVRFIAAREAHARAASGCDYTAFCAVIRAADHPARPAGDAGLGAFWQKRGYTNYPDLICTMRWTEIGGAVDVENRLSFWIKSLSGRELP